MKELIRTNDPVLLSWAGALLEEAGIVSFQFDSHMSVMEGSISAIPRRLMVADEDYARARAMLVEAGELTGE